MLLRNYVIKVKLHTTEICYIKKSQSFDFNLGSTGDSTNIKTIIIPKVNICMSIDSQALLL